MGSTSWGDECAPLRSSERNTGDKLPARQIVVSAWEQARQTAETLGLQKLTVQIETEAGRLAFLAEWDELAADASWSWTTKAAVNYGGRTIGAITFEADAVTTPLDTCAGPLARLLHQFESRLALGRLKPHAA